MTNLRFVYGTMNVGKTANLIMTAHNYTSVNKRVLVMKSSIDTKAIGSIESRALGMVGVDFTIHPNDTLNDIDTTGIECIFVDEAQFLTKTNVIGLRYHANNVNVICYGLKSDYMCNLFGGSKLLFELADIIEELPRVCSLCDKKALVNAKYVKSADKISFIRNGSDKPDIGGNEKYMPICWKCWV